MSDANDQAATTEQDASQRATWGPDPRKDDDADAALDNTRAQLRGTSLEGTEAGRSLEQLEEGAERASRQPGYGREGK